MAYKDKTPFALVSQRCRDFLGAHTGHLRERIEAPHVA